MLSIVHSPLSFTAPLAPIMRSRGISMVAETPASPPPAPVPLTSTMRVGDNTLAGDFGFDPFQLAESPERLAYYREAEVKHARLAMLAAAGWPMAELLNKPLSDALGVKSILTKSGESPSILNGGLGNVPAVYWALILGLAIYVEAKSLDTQLNIGKRDPKYIPGMLQFDPLGMDSPTMRNAEITNGRIGMIAITAFALEEFVFKTPVVAETPIFFKPIWSMF
jgi:hypothetical protein|uniref:Chloroplast light-harvesting complex protein Lhcz1 nuclear n=1 Tax=Isochrysis galbana TaxID=37099 RepID=A4QPP6_ISOGA|nr:TPA_inf: chloroplast light-harvesting complex protein precursor Lhcz1; nuclear [Isochrysis galbana]